MLKEVFVPDIGDYTNVEIIEVAVKAGDNVAFEDTLITLETDKATMDIPAPFAGKVSKMHVAVGDKISQGSLILVLEVVGEQEIPVKLEVDAASKQPEAAVSQQTTVITAATQTAIKDVLVPDIGDYTDVDVIEVVVKVGDVVGFEDTLITLETDKATMDIPAPFAGKITKLQIAVGDKVSQGSFILQLETGDSASVNTQVASPASAQAAVGVDAVVNTPSTTAAQSVKSAAITVGTDSSAQNLPSQKDVYAGPGVRRFARELGVDLTKVQGSARKGRILKQDVQNYVKKILQNPAAAGSGGGLGFDLPPMTKVDFQKFGEIEYKPLSRIKKISGSYLHRNWLHIPHVTHFEDADTTKMEQFRKSAKPEADKRGTKLTPLVFIMKAIVAGLKEFPNFNASLDVDGSQLILKKYFHIGVAVDTPNGLVVPVVRDADKKDVFQLAQDLSALSQKARDGKLVAADMQGGCFSISSLGGIGGRAFTPIINAPEVAILGVSKANMQPVYIDGKFEPRLMLPLSLSYDHRVIDGAEAARFASFVRHQLEALDDLLK